MRAKTTTRAALLGAALCASLAACGPKGGSGTEGAGSARQGKPEAARSEAPKDVFFYNGQHRKDKYVPTGAKMAFAREIQSVNTDEFLGNQSLREVWIGAQIKHVANNAFKGCASLEQVHFQGPLPVINDGAFEGCSSLKALRADAYTVGLDAFKGCASLQSARFGEHIYWIREGAFEGCRSLKSLLLAITMQKLEDGAFRGCVSMQEFSVPNDFKNRMFGMFPNPAAWRRVYLLATEYYDMPKNCQPSAQCALYVPDAFLARFRADPQWSRFGSVEPLSKSRYYTAEGFLK